MPPLNRQKDDGQHIENGVEDNRLHRYAERGLHVVLRLEERNEALLDREEAKSESVDRQGPRDAHRRRRVKGMAFVNEPDDPRRAEKRDD